jgi:hypothetical protein
MMSLDLALRVDETNPNYFHIRLLRSILIWSPSIFQMASPFRFVENISDCIFHLSHICYMSRPPHVATYVQSSNVRWKVQIMEAKNVYFSPVSCYSFSLKEPGLMPENFFASKLKAYIFIKFVFSN